MIQIVDLSFLFALIILIFKYYSYNKIKFIF